MSGAPTQEQEERGEARRHRAQAELKLFRTPGFLRRELRARSLRLSDSEPRKNQQSGRHRAQ
jgi:hypothetical protein